MLEERSSCSLRRVVIGMARFAMESMASRNRLVKVDMSIRSEAEGILGQWAIANSAK